MLTLKEHIAITELYESWESQFSDEQLEKAEFYKISKHPVSAKYTVALYDQHQEFLGNVDFEDVDFAIGFVEEYFDVGDTVEVWDGEDWAAVATSTYGSAGDLTIDSGQPTSQLIPPYDNEG